MSGTRIENISRFIKMNSFPFHLNYTRKFVIYLELILIIETHYLQRYLITGINFNNVFKITNESYKINYLKES